MSYNGKIGLMSDIFQKGHLLSNIWNIGTPIPKIVRFKTDIFFGSGTKALSLISYIANQTKVNIQFKYFNAFQSY